MNTSTQKKALLSLLLLMSLASCGTNPNQKQEQSVSQKVSVERGDANTTSVTEGNQQSGSVAKADSIAQVLTETNIGISMGDVLKLIGAFGLFMFIIALCMPRPKIIRWLFE